MGKKNHPPVDKKKQTLKPRKESLNNTFKTKIKTNITYCSKNKLTIPWLVKSWANIQIIEHKPQHSKLINPKKDNRCIDNGRYLFASG